MQVKQKWLSAACGAALLGLVGTAAFGAASGSLHFGPVDTGSPANDARVAGPAATPSAPGSLPDMVDRVSPAVVQIQVQSSGRPARQERYDDGDDQGPGGFFGQGYDPSPGRSGPARAGLGSGFVIDSQGVIVTNNHVVEGADQVRVKFSDGRVLEGEVMGTDPKTDLAVIRVHGGRFQPVSWGDSDHLRVGESVFAVGSPFGLGNTVTAGILSARGRQIGESPYEDFLQVDAAINSGNSGGPLFNSQGAVVGVNTAIFSPSGGNVGIGFAIPSHTVRAVATQIMASGTVSRGRIGVLLQPPAQNEGDNGPPAKGAVIAQVQPGGPAERAGLQPGDLVTSFNGRQIADNRALAQAVAEAPAGSTARATVRRDGQSRTVGLQIERTEEG